MNLHGYLWENEEDGTGGLVKADIKVERTDSDEVAIFASGEDDAEATLYVSVETAVRLGALLSIAALAHEIQAHEAAEIATRDGA